MGEVRTAPRSRTSLPLQLILPTSASREARAWEKQMADIDAKRHVVTIEINGVRNTVSVEARKLLVHLIRDDLGLTGTHIGCNTSQFAACTAHIDDEAVKSSTALPVM